MTLGAFLTVEGAASELGYSTKTIYRALHSGDLRGYQRAGRKGNWRIHRDDLTAWIMGAPLSN